MDQRNRSGYNVAHDKIDRQANLGDSSIYYENQTNNVFVNNENLSDLIKDIDDLLIQAASLPQDSLVKLQNWKEILLEPGGAARLGEIKHYFGLEEAKLKGVARDPNNQLKIWLNRREQRLVFDQSIQAFYEQEQIGVFVFCIIGDHDRDGVGDAAEMLRLYYFNDILKCKPDDKVKEVRYEQMLSLKSKENAAYYFKNILCELLLLSKIRQKENELIEKLTHDFKDHHVVIHCKVDSSCHDEGLIDFFNFWLNKINKDRIYPLLVFIEFYRENFEKINTLVRENFQEHPIKLLPVLNEITGPDWDEFFSRPCYDGGQLRSYSDIFIRGSIPETPLCYRDAKNKLLLKKYH